ncbi:MAG: nucleotide sugar dehydrogenase [Candidatus Magnetominusculus sp. LBB02]|nr:nucleotide sugar dehydrogenase [Candidatus Magnetominusculus sp. LBB02]
MGYDVCIVGGLGHVGLPLGIMLAGAGGKKVALYDINTKAADLVSKGRMPFLEAGAEEILKDVIGKRLFVSNDRAVITESHYVIIVIGTPVDEHLNPQFTIFKQFFDDLSGCLKDGQHIILRSTVFPGTTEKIKEYLAAKGKTVRVSFCPERIAEGKAIVELRALPQIVASFDSESQDEAAALFGALTDKIIYLTPIEAELAKLFTNVWRYIQFSISNQFYQIATQHNLDFYKIYNAITYEYPRAASFPSAGFAAGPCLFKDTMQLAAFSNNSFFLGHAAMLINEGLPNFIVSTLKARYCLKDKIVGILGMAFKANNDDRRESLSYKLKKIVEIEAKQVLCSDVYINEPGFVTVEDLVDAVDIIILGTPHSQYAGLKIPEGKVMVDMWNFYGNGGLF